MGTCTFSLPEEKAEQLALSAQELGVPVEELLRKITDDCLTRKKDFLLASEYVLQKNTELYRRLAK